MPKVITIGSIVQCTHQGKVTFPPSQQKLKVGGQAVLVVTDVPTGKVSNCQTKTTPKTKPCLNVTGPPVGVATKLKVNGVFVLLDTTTGTTDGQAPAPGTWSVTNAIQTKLNAI